MKFSLLDSSTSYIRLKQYFLVIFFFKNRQILVYHGIHYSIFFKVILFRKHPFFHFSGGGVGVSRFLAQYTRIFWNSWAVIFGHLEKPLQNHFTHSQFFVALSSLTSFKRGKGAWVVAGTVYGSSFMSLFSAKTTDHFCCQGQCK